MFRPQVFWVICFKSQKWPTSLRELCTKIPLHSSMCYCCFKWTNSLWVMYLSSKDAHYLNVSWNSYINLIVGTRHVRLHARVSPSTWPWILETKTLSHPNNLFFSSSGLYFSNLCQIFYHFTIFCIPILMSRFRSATIYCVQNGSGFGLIWTERIRWLCYEIRPNPTSKSSNLLLWSKDLHLISNSWSLI